MAERWPVLLMVRELGIGGCERDLTKMARRLDRTRFEPHVGCFIDEGFRGQELRDAGVPVLRLPVRSFRSYSAVRGFVLLRKYVREHGIRLVHAFDIPTDVFGVPAALLAGVPAVIASQLSYRSMYTRAERVLMAGIDRIAHRIVVNSHAVAKELSEERGVPAAKLYVSHNGVETNEFYPAPAPRSAALQDASLIIGTVCALRAEKRVDLLIRAFARVRDLDPGIRLLVVGSGVERPALEQLAVELHVRQFCHFAPSTADVAPWMRSMDIFAVTSSIESFPNALLEAMACGCAPVASAVGGVPELVTDGHSGLLFPPGDIDSFTRALELLIRDAALRTTVAQHAASVARNEFSIEQNVRRAEALYEALITGRPIVRETVGAPV